MKKKNRIQQIIDHLPNESRAIGVIISEQSKTGVEPAALFARFNDSNVKLRQPSTGALQRFRERRAFPDACQHPPKRRAVRRRGRIAFHLLQSGHQPKAGRGELAELMIEISALDKRARRQNHSTSKPQSSKNTIYLRRGD